VSPYQPIGGVIRVPSVGAKHSTAPRSRHPLPVYQEAASLHSPPTRMYSYVSTGGFLLSVYLYYDSLRASSKIILSTSSSGYYQILPQHTNIVNFGYFSLQHPGCQLTCLPSTQCLARSDMASTKMCSTWSRPSTAP
jgi:hypothetical protein